MKAILAAHSFTEFGAQTNVYLPNKGEGIPSHEHDYPHVTLCTAGRIVVRMDGKERELTRDDQPVMLPANQRHEIEALEDGSGFVNIFAGGKAL